MDINKVSYVGYQWTPTKYGLLGYVHRFKFLLSWEAGGRPSKFTWDVWLHCLIVLLHVLVLWASTSHIELELLTQSALSAKKKFLVCRGGLDAPDASRRPD